MPQASHHAKCQMRISDDLWTIFTIYGLCLRICESYCYLQELPLTIVIVILLTNAGPKKWDKNSALADAPSWGRRCHWQHHLLPRCRPKPHPPIPGRTARRQKPVKFCAKPQKHICLVKPTYPKTMIIIQDKKKNLKGKICPRDACRFLRSSKCLTNHSPTIHLPFAIQGLNSPKDTSWPCRLCPCCAVSCRDCSRRWCEPGQNTDPKPWIVDPMLNL